MVSLSVQSGERIAIGDAVAVQVFPESDASFRVAVSAPEETEVVSEQDPTIAPFPQRSQWQLTLEALSETDQPERLQAELRQLARDIAENMPAPDSNECKNLMGTFITELMTCFTERGIQESRRKRQRKGIDAAKARGVQFGNRSCTLPDNFDETHRAWRAGEITLRTAAATCGMAKSTFYNAALRKEKAAASE